MSGPFCVRVKRKGSFCSMSISGLCYCWLKEKGGELCYPISMPGLSYGGSKKRDGQLSFHVYVWLCYGGVDEE